MTINNYKYTYNTKGPNTYKIINCEICGPVKVPTSYIVYEYGGSTFCTWNCKIKYKKAHPELEELPPAERMIEYLLKQEKNTKNNYKRKKEKNNE